MCNPLMDEFVSFEWDSSKSGERGLGPFCMTSDVPEKENLLLFYTHCLLDCVEVSTSTAFILATLLVLVDGPGDAGLLCGPDHV